MPFLASAQLQNAPMGFEMGRMTMQEAINRLTREGYHIRRTADNTVYADNICFADVCWDNVGLSFYKDKLYRVIFQLDDQGTKTKAVQQFYKSLYEKLINKYLPYKTESREFDLQFVDNKSMIALAYSPQIIQEITQSNVLFLAYIDIKLANMTFEEDDGL